MKRKSRALAVLTAGVMIATLAPAATGRADAPVSNRASLKQDLCYQIITDRFFDGNTASFGHGGNHGRCIKGKHLPEHVGLGAEMPMHEGMVDPGSGRDLAHRKAVGPTLGYEVPGRREDGRPDLLSAAGLRVN